MFPAEHRFFRGPADWVVDSLADQLAYSLWYNLPTGEVSDEDKAGHHCCVWAQEFPWGLVCVDSRVS